MSARGPGHPRLVRHHIGIGEREREREGRLWRGRGGGHGRGPAGMPARRHTEREREAARRDREEGGKETEWTRRALDILSGWIHSLGERTDTWSTCNER